MIARIQANMLHLESGKIYMHVHVAIFNLKLRGNTMLKLKNPIYVLLLLTFLLCFHPIDNSIAGSCDEKASSGGTPTFSGNFNIPPGFECPENPTLEYDTVNSAETIDRNGSANLVVIGNNGPYTWSVSGTGFTLETEDEPTGPTNALHADGSACGAATITVTGCDGTQVHGYVRCATGVWGSIIDGPGYCSTLALAETPGCSAENTSIIEGKTKVQLTFGCKFYLTGCGPGIYSPPYSPSGCGALVEPYHTYTGCSTPRPPNDYRCCYVRLAYFYEWRCHY